MPLVVRNIQEVGRSAVAQPVSGNNDQLKAKAAPRPSFTTAGNNGEPSSRQSHEILQGRSHASMTKCIRMLSQLSLYSKEVFADLVTLVQDTNHRIVKLNQHVEQLQRIEIESITVESFVTSTKSSLWAGLAVDESVQASVSPVPALNSSINSSLNASITTSTFHSKQHRNAGVSLVDRYTLPKSLRTAIHALQAPPDFSELEQYSSNFKILPSQKLILANRYSYPEYFLGQWCEAQERRLQATQQETKLRKQEKKKRLETRQSLQQRRPSTSKQVLNWKDRFSSDGKKKEEDKKRPVGLKAQLSRRSFGNQSASPASPPHYQLDDDDVVEPSVVSEDKKTVLQNLFPNDIQQEEVETKTKHEVVQEDKVEVQKTVVSPLPPFPVHKATPPPPSSSAVRRPSAASEVGSIASSSGPNTPRDDPRYSQVYNERIVSDRINPELASSPTMSPSIDTSKTSHQFTPKFTPPRPPPPPPGRRSSTDSVASTPVDAPESRRSLARDDSDSSDDERGATTAVRRRSRADSISSNIDSEQQFIPKSIAYYHKADVVEDVSASIEKVSLSHAAIVDETTPKKAEEVFAAKPRPPRPPPPPPKLPPTAARMESSVAVESNANKRLLVKSMRVQNYADILASAAAEKSPVPVSQDGKGRSEASVMLAQDSPTAQSSKHGGFFSHEEHVPVQPTMQKSTPPAAALPPMGNLLQSIRLGGSLRKVEVVEKVVTTPSASATNNTSALGGFANAEAVQKILERRKYVQAEDSESEDSDEDSGW